MLRRLNSFFHSNTDPLKSLSDEESQRIETVSNNLDSIDSTSNESNRFSYFRRIVSGFQSTFQNLTPWQSQTEKIKSIYNRFTNNLFNNSILQLIFENEDVYRPLFKSLIIMTHQNNDIVPMASKFIPFFCQLIKSSKNSSNNKLLVTSFDFLTLLFKSPEFFNEFLEIDGVTLIFTSFFLSNDKEPIDLMLNLLFCVVPPDFYKEPSMTTISIIQDALKEDSESQTESKCTPKCSLFIVNYLCAHYSTCPSIFSTFRSDGGFLALNNFLKKCCTIKDSLDCYKLMTTKTDNDPIIIHSLYELYIDSSETNKTQILKFLLTINANDVQRAIQITDWIIDLNDMTDEQVELVARIMLNLNYQNYISFVLNLIEDLSLRFEILDIFLDLIHMLIATDKIPVSELIDRKFVENFLEKPTDPTFIDFVTSHEAMTHILLALFKDPKCVEYRYSIVSKLIQCSNLKLTGLLKQLCNYDFTIEIFNLLLNNLEKSELVELLIYEISNNIKSFKLFVQSNGFKKFDEILEKITNEHINALHNSTHLTKKVDNPTINEIKNDSDENEIDNSNITQIKNDSKAQNQTENSNTNETQLKCNNLNGKNKLMTTNLVRIIGALTNFGPKPQIDEWINSLPLDSPFFTFIDEKLLGEIAVNDRLFLNVPSLLPYVDKFDFTSPICLFNAGKYGIPMFLKKRIPITEIPSLDRISNRYAPPTILNHLMSQMDKLDTFIDITVPQYPIFELVPMHFNNPTTSSNQNSTDVNTSNPNTSDTSSNVNTNNSTSQSNNITQTVNNQNDMKNFKLPVSLRFKCINNQNISSIKFEFMIKTTNETKSNLLTNNKLTIMSCPQLIITYNDSIITFLTNKSEVSVYAKKGESNTIRITFNLMDLDIYLNNVKLDKLKYDQGYPNEIIFGDPINQTQVPMQSSNIVTNELFNQSTIYLYRNLTINDQIPYVYESTQNVYTVGYLGFASYFSDMKEAEKLFLLLENSHSLQEFTSTYIALLKIQKSRNIPKKKFWPRILLSIKRSETFVQDNLLLFLHQLPSNVYVENDFTYFIRSVLCDFEMYFVFTEKDLLSFLQLIELLIDDSTSGINQFLLIGSNGEMINEFVYIMRMGISTNLKNQLLKIIRKMLVKNEYIKEFLHQSLCVGDWTLQLPLELKEYPIQSLLSLPISESKLQIDFFKVFFEAVSNNQNELFSLSELLQYANFFDDIERSMIFYRLIAIYSKRNSKFIQNSVMLQKAFCKHVTSRQMWCEAFSILQGKVDSNDIFKKKSKHLPKHPYVSRPLFVDTILSMLCELLKQSLTNKELVNDVMSTMTLFDDYSHFNHIPFLLHLANFGRIPSSFSISPNQRQDIEISLANVSLTAKELESISDNSVIFKSSDIQNAFLQPEVHFDNFDLSQEIENLPFHSLLIFLSSVALTNENVLNVLSFGTNLFYDDYNRKFTCEFISQVIVQCTQMETVKVNPLPIALKAAKMSVFENNYLHFLSLVLSLTRKFFDQQYIKELRELVLLSFHFLKGFQERIDLDNLLKSYETIIFSPVMLDDSNYYHFLTFFDKQIKPIQKYQVNYDRIETEKKWNDYVLTITKTIDVDTRNLYGTQILTNFKNNIITKLKFDLMTKITRICNHYNRTIEQANGVNRYLRRYEDFYFKTILYEYFTNNVQQKEKAKSYHMSLLTMPYSCPRLIVKSPFEIKSPPKGSKVNLDYFKYVKQRPISKISQVDFNGDLLINTEWFIDQRPFEYSYVLMNFNLLEDFQKQFGCFNEIVQVYLYFYIHPIPCVLFFNNDKMCLLFLSSIRDNKLGLISNPHSPISLIPFNEMVYLMEWHNVSLFCGHYVFTFESSRFIKLEAHRYVHQKRALSFFYMFDPNFILIFDSLIDYENIDKKVRLLSNLKSEFMLKDLISIYNPNSYDRTTNTTMGKGLMNLFLFNLSFENCLKLWLERKISTFDYLLFLNYQGGRSFSDCAQYPVFPWIKSPNLDINRDLEKPMGQQDPKRALHYDETFNESIEPNKYYYGCHYSLPGAVFWFMMRMPPFCYFLWDMNEGWDDTQRIFFSANEAYLSASKINQTDLKEPIPQIYSCPEMYLNLSSLQIEDNRQNVILPTWSNNSPFYFTEVYRKVLESCEQVNQWIDLIFGYKETGENALKAKNLFLPSAYHSSSADSLEIDINAFEDQVILFGQCPLQLFTKEHPKRIEITKNCLEFVKKLNQKVISLNKQQSMPLPQTHSNAKFELHTELASLHNRLTNQFNNQSNRYFDENKNIEKNRTCPSFNQADVDDGKPKRQSACLQDPTLIDYIISPKQARSRSRTTIQKPTKRKIKSKYEHLFTSSLVKYSQLIEFADTKIDKNVFLLRKSVSIPPTHDYYLVVEDINECISVRKTDNNDLMCAVISPEFKYIKHITISDDGAFCAISYENGYVKAYFIYYELKIPKNIKLVQTFKFDHMCRMSCVLSSYFICASVFNNQIVLWNIANGYMHRKIDLVGDEMTSFDFEYGIAFNFEKVVDVMFDPFDDSLYVLTNRRIVQFTINGIKLREIYTNQIIETDNHEVNPNSNQNEMTENVAANSNDVKTNSNQNEMTGNVTVDSNDANSNSDKSSEMIQNTQFEANSNSNETVNSNSKMPNKNDINTNLLNSKGIKQSEISNSLEMELTCFGLLPYDFNYDSRILVVGNNFGNLIYLIANEEGNSFKVLQIKEMFKSKIKNIFVYKKEMKIWCCDEKNHVIELFVNEDENIPNTTNVQFVNFSPMSSPKSPSPLSGLS